MTALSIFIILALTGCHTSGITSTSGSNNLQESPQTYVLTGDDIMLTMPTVTLYENGDARLSQPPISSIAPFGLGHYQLSGDELTVTYDEGASATFLVSDAGDTLTLTATNVGFTKIGAVYQYRPKADYLSIHNKINGEKLTLEVVRELAKKAPDLTFSDFEKYVHFDIDPDYHVFEIEDKYTLRIICSTEGDTSFAFEQNSSGERFPLNLNGSTGLVFEEFLGLVTIPKYQAREWLDYYHDDNLPWDDSIDITLPEFPSVTFTWTSEKVTVNDIELFWGMPVWNVYLADLNNDGKPEFCATVSMGSGIVDTRVIVYDYVSGQEYQLSSRMIYDYSLSIQDGIIMVTQSDYRDGKPLATRELQLVNGEIAGFDNDNPDDIE
jgi:hypothetical protein